MAKSSWRGVQFHVLDVTATGGRRLVVHEYPNQALPYIEDMGAAARKWAVKAFIVRVGIETASTFQSRKYALIDACAQGGPGSFLHPLGGSFVAQCESCEVNETASSLNYVEFNLALVESGEILTPKYKAPSLAAILGAALLAALRLGLAIRRAARATDDLVRRAMAGHMFSVANSLLGVSGQLSGVDVAPFQAGLFAIRDAPASTHNDAESSAAAWQTLLTATTTKTSALAVLGGLMTGAVDSQNAALAGGLTASQQAAADNAADIDLFIATTAWSHAATVAAGVRYVTYEDAIRDRDSLLDTSATLSSWTTDAATSASLMDLRATTATAITEGAIDLPRVRAITLLAPTTALELATALYGDPTRAKEVVARNNLSDPNAVSGSIYVLTV